MKGLNILRYLEFIDLKGTVQAEFNIRRIEAEVQGARQVFLSDRAGSLIPPTAKFNSSSFLCARYCVSVSGPAHLPSHPFLFLVLLRINVVVYRSKFEPSPPLTFCERTDKYTTNFNFEIVDHLILDHECFVRFQTRPFGQTQQIY